MGHNDYGHLLTIVLTLKDRSAFTYRWMQWMEENRCPYKILIADGGSDKEIENHLSHHENYPALNYEYFRYPYDKDIPTFLHKHADIVSKVDTPYLIVMADNDDFFCLEGIEKSIAFLENNTEFFGCGGEVLYGILRDSEHTHHPDDHLSGDNFEMFLEKTGFLYDLDLPPTEKVSRFFAQTHESTTWYYVYKTEPVKTVLRQIVEYNFSNFDVHERFVYLSFWLTGKIKRLSLPYMVRQSNTSSNNDLPTRKFSKAYLFVADEEYVPSIQRMIRHFSSLISETNEHLELVRTTVAKYYEKKLHDEKRCKSFNLISHLRKFKALRKLYHSLFSSFSDTQLVDLSLEKNRELKKISTFLRNYKNAQ